MKSIGVLFYSIFVLVSHLALSSLFMSSAHAVMVATLPGHERDIQADGRNVHLIVAGYGGEMGSLTYEMAVSRANKLKRDFPNDRVVIIGSTPQRDGATTRFSPSELERRYNISVGYRGQDTFRNAINDQRPLTGDYLSSIVLNLVTSAEDRNRFRQANPNTPYNTSTVRQAMASGQLPQGGQIASMDFMTHSSPISGIFLHDTNMYFHPTNNTDASATSFLARHGMGVDDQGALQIVNRDLALRALNSTGRTLSVTNQIVDMQGQPTDFRFSFEEGGQRRRFSIESNGNLYEGRGLPGGSESRMLEADSPNFHYLNGLFTPDAYVNVSGCSGGYGLIEDMSRVLGVPVNGSATGSLVEVMDQNGDFYYNYPASNPYGDGELSESRHGSQGHELAPGAGRSVVGLRVDQRLYYGYWGILRSGTNFVTSSCHIRNTEPYATEDRQRCEMGMARSMEDALTSTTVNLQAGDLSFDDFTNVLIERMCPGGFSERGYISESQREVQELTVLRDNCRSAVRSLSYLNQYCSNQNSEYMNRVFGGEVVSSNPQCQNEERNFIQNHRHYVPLVDRLGQTLHCTLENGCEVELMGCEVTDEERNQCLAVNPDEDSQEHKSCLITKRCQIDESRTRAGNQNNPTFMRFIQNYMSGYHHLNNYRQGQLTFTTRPSGPVRTEETQRFENRTNSVYPNGLSPEILEGTY